MTDTISDNEVKQDRLQVLKLQWPLMGDTVLGYNEDRSLTFQIPCNMFDGDFREVMEILLKVYIKGYIDDDGKLVVDEWVVEEPNW